MGGSECRRFLQRDKMAVRLFVEAWCLFCGIARGSCNKGLKVEEG